MLLLPDLHLHTLFACISTQKRVSGAPAMTDRIAEAWFEWNRTDKASMHELISIIINKSSPETIQ